MAEESNDNNTGETAEEAERLAESKRLLEARGAGRKAKRVDTFQTEGGARRGRGRSDTPGKKPHNLLTPKKEKAIAKRRAAGVKAAKKRNAELADAGPSTSDRRFAAGLAGVAKAIEALPGIEDDHPAHAFRETVGEMGVKIREALER